MSDEDYDFGLLSDSSSESGEDESFSSSKNKNIKLSDDQDFIEPIKKETKLKTAKDPKTTKPKPKAKIQSTSTISNQQKTSTNTPSVGHQKLVGSLGPKLKLPPPRRCGLSRRAVYT